MLPYSIPTEYKKLLLQLDKEWDIENYDFFFYSKKLITLEKIVGKNGQKRDFASPLLSLLRGGEGRGFGYGDILVRGTQVLNEFPILLLEMVVLSNLLYFARQSP